MIYAGFEARQYHGDGGDGSQNEGESAYRAFQSAITPPF